MEQHIVLRSQFSFMTTINTRITRILIADDHAIVREGFHTMIERLPKMQMVGEAENGKELVGMALELKPDIIITDIKMPLMDGVEATRILTEELPATGIIAFTLFNEEELVGEMLEAGALGYLLKSSSRQEILDAIQAVCDGKTYYCSQTTVQMAKIIARSRPGAKGRFAKPGYTEKEKAIIRLICEELSNKEIAARLGISMRTVEGHRERIQEKMKVRNTAGIVVMAIKEGIFKV